MKTTLLLISALSLLSGCSKAPNNIGPSFIKVGEYYMILWDTKAFSEYGNFSPDKNEFKILKKESDNWYLAEWKSGTEIHQRWINLDFAVVVSERK
jgi:hypothetical protein